MSDVHPYPRLARTTVERLLNGEALPTGGESIETNAEWNKERACFVSIKTLDGSLRGCIGTILPTQRGLDLEIIANAVAASTRDPRFSPMTPPELEEVVFSVDVLGLPEPISDSRELDPSVWGVIVAKGARRGVLLPGLEGVDTVEAQLEIAARKAGLTSLDGVKIERFRADRYSE
jgi:AmmeMemoRadiSam system protein A